MYFWKKVWFENPHRSYINNKTRLESLLIVHSIHCSYRHSYSDGYHSWWEQAFSSQPGSVCFPVCISFVMSLRFGLQCRCVIHILILYRCTASLHLRFVSLVAIILRVKWTHAVRYPIIVSHKRSCERTDRDDHSFASSKQLVWKHCH